MMNGDIITEHLELTQPEQQTQEKQSKVPPPLASDTIIQVKVQPETLRLANPALFRQFPTFPGGEPFPTNTFLPFVEIPRKHRQLGGDAGFLGAAISGVDDNNRGGYWVRYKNGTIVYTTSTGAHEIHGEVYNKWESLAGLRNPFNKAKIGFPITDTTTVLYGGQFNTFEAKDGSRKAIYWSPSTPVSTIEGPILDRFENLGSELGCGFPLQDTKSPSTGGMIGNFKKNDGTLVDIYWSEQSGAHALYGPIRDKYISLGAERVGYPSTDIINAPNGSGSFADFSNGMTIFHSLTDGTFATTGAIRYRHEKMGGYAAYGYPTNDQTQTTDGRGVYQNFTGGRAIYHPSVNGFAAAIYGEIKKRYDALGGPTSFLGLPTTNEGRGSDNGGRFNDFEHGTIYWSPQTGAIESTSIAEQLVFQRNHHFSSGVAANGSSKLVIKRDGSFDFGGHMRATHLMSYNFICTYTLVDADGLIYVFANHGTIYGTLVPGRRDKDWHTPDVNESIRDNWRAINAQYRMHINAHMGASPGVLIAEIIGVVVLGGVAVVIAVSGAGGDKRPKVTVNPPGSPGSIRIEY